ncbi:MAG: RagB/SusD family nutrient uptake outer membrane protein, partial [Muribaculaceae bacterium]|nr:RagB/SusD family nutrient uptake outer membrane protein [Muribaculaceae bacterium]
MNKILKYFTIAMLGASVASCDDFFELKPKNEMVLEEFWQNESDVLAVVGSCYRSMQEPGC